MLVLDTNIPSHAMLTISKMAKWIDSVSGNSIVGRGANNLNSLYFWGNRENGLNLRREIRD